MLLIAVHWPDKMSEIWTKQIHVNPTGHCKDWSAHVFHVYSMSGSKIWDIKKLYEREYDMISSGVARGMWRLTYTAAADTSPMLFYPRGDSLHKRFLFQAKLINTQKIAKPL
jgi:hypothetical protein